MTSAEERWRQAILPVNSTIQQAIRNLDQVAIKIVLVVNETGELQGTISDGDIRRGLLRGLDLNSSIASVIHLNALVVPPDMKRESVMQLMAANKIHQIPVVDEHYHVVGLHLWDEITTPQVLPNLMVIMAGGMGTRLRPKTENCPKPMLPVAGKPMLEHIIERAKREGFVNFVISLHYLGQVIREHFKDGANWGVAIRYLQEDTPLGTAGALALLAPPPDLPFLVSNGDVLSDIRYGEMLSFHQHYRADATMAVRQHEWQHPFGVVRTNGIAIVGFEEKPVHRTNFNAGIYVLNPTALKVLDKGQHCDMPTLFEKLQLSGGQTIAYSMHEPWLDLGRPEDLQSANETTS